MSKRVLILFALLWLAGGSFAAAADDALRVDYRYYALDGWIGAIGLPDDAYKCVMNADGRFLAELGVGPGQGSYPHRPAVKNVLIQADLAGGAVRVDQRMISPRAPLAVTRKRQGEIAVTEYLFLARPLDWSAAVAGAALADRNSKPDARQYLLMVEYANAGTKPAEIRPIVRLAGASLAAGGGAASSTTPLRTRCRISADVESFQSAGAGQGLATLKTITLQPRARAHWVLAIQRNGYRDAQPLDWEAAQKLREKALTYWEKSAGLPYDAVAVPDAEIQALVDASIRELYQMRYVIRGLPAYFFGPNGYNDYWVLDGSFVTEAMDMLGRVEDAGGYADYLLLHQQADGRIQCMSKHWKETGIALVTLLRHARLTQDKPWLSQRWPQFCRAVEAIRQLRGNGASADPKALNYGLAPVGFGDGGIGADAPEFANNHWLLAGMKAAVEAAQWLGKTGEGHAWQREYADYQRAFQKAIQRDAKLDARGNRFIPVLMGPAVPAHPTRGQWAFCQGVYPGRIFAKDDPLMLGTLAMLAGHEVQGGIVEDSGWIGVWPQCGSFYGHDWLWLGEGQKAARLLYAFANHASPLGNWREEMPRQNEPRQRFPFAKGSGDMPHVSAAAEFLRLVIHLVELDRGDELHLLEGFPLCWARPGMVTRLSGVCTPFGALHLVLRADAEGKTAALAVQPLAGECKAIVVHLPDGRTARIEPRNGGRLTFPLAISGGKPVDIAPPR